MTTHEIAPDTSHTHRRHAPPWVFGITGVPYGICGTFVGTVVPFYARKAGIDMDAIGWFGLALMIPTWFQFLYAPIIDIGPKRKHWLVIVSVLGAACLAGALMMPLPGKVVPFLALTFAGQLISGLVGSCNGGIISSSMPDELRGKTAGWLNTGNLAGGALGGWAAVVMRDRFDPRLIGLVIGALMLFPSLAALLIPEPDRVRQKARELFGTMIHDVWNVVRQRSGWTGILVCASPVGTAALLNYFSAVAVDYNAPDSVVGFVNGWASGLVTAAGSVVGGYICDRIPRRVAYLGAGALTAVCGLVMRLAPLAPNTYVVGVLVYLFVAGLCYAAFSAFIFEVVGNSVGRAASTQYTLFTAAGNLAIGYTGWLDTRFHKTYGVRGLLACDAIANLVGIALLMVLFRLVLRGRDGSPAQQAAAPAAE